MLACLCVSVCLCLFLAEFARAHARSFACSLDAIQLYRIWFSKNGREILDTRIRCWGYERAVSHMQR